VENDNGRIASAALGLANGRGNVQTVFGFDVSLLDGGAASLTTWMYLSCGSATVLPGLSL